MKKSLVIARVFPPQIGGSGQWMYQLYSGMPAGEFVVAAGNWPGSQRFDEQQNLSIVRVNLDFQSWGALGWRSGADYLSAYQHLQRILSEHGVEAVHAACCLPEGFLAWMLCRRLGMPYLVYVHGEELNVMRSSRELSWMTRRVLGGASTIIANSQNTAGILSAQWEIPAANIRVLHPGVDAAQFCPAPRDPEVRRRLGWDDRRVVLSVGRLQRRKGHAQLLKALSRVKSAVPDVLVAIVGEGDERDDLRRLIIELELQEYVVLHGDLQGADLLCACQQCDLFALPNIEVAGDIEGFGIVLLEAQACGRPVLAGDSGGTAETMRVGETGVIVDCDDVDQLAATLCNLLNDDLLRERMGKVARQWVRDTFDWNQLRPAALQVFADAFASESRRGTQATLVSARAV